MTTKAKKKPMTAKEKKERAAFRTDLRERGIIPKPKKPLNRKAFIEDAKEDFNRTINFIEDDVYILEALSEMVGTGFQPTLENIGAAKVMKLACEIKRFHAEMRAAGRKNYTVGEYVDRLEPIYKA